jgi:biopolymer transport protein ExbB
MKALKEFFGSVFNFLVIIVALIVGYYIWKNVMGNPINFEGLNPKGHPVEGNFLGMVYKGGFIVPLLMAIVLTVVTFVIERFISLRRAAGRGRTSKFLRNIQSLMNEGKVDEASAACDKQKGSLANVIKGGLYRYKELQRDATLPSDQKVLALQKDFEEATALELPMLSKNMVVISTIASISVLTGLLGTVLGMIRAFGALATQGAPDALALSTGISEALVNTAFGIGGSLIAILMYNYFSAQIDDMTYKIDEASFSLTQTFASTLKK